MKCTFYRPENVNLDEYENIIGKMEYDLKKLISEETYDLDIYYYIWRLTKEARPLENKPDMVFWGMDDPKEMPSDARHYYFYKPTYIATAFLMQALLKYPELENGGEVNWEYGEECVNKLFEILPKAMNGCTGRDLAGGGYNSLKGQLQNMKLFLEADAVTFIEKYPNMCPAFTELLKKILTHYESCLQIGDTTNSWGEDYSEQMKEILEMAGRK